MVPAKYTGNMHGMLEAVQWTVRNASLVDRELWAKLGIVPEPCLHVHAHGSHQSGLRVPAGHVRAWTRPGSKHDLGLVLPQAKLKA